MKEFLEQVIAGIAAGGIYASLALALVLIYRAMGLINFAQGEFAMFTAFICWALLQGFELPFGLAVLVSVLIGAAGASHVRPELQVLGDRQLPHGAPPLRHVGDAHAGRIRGAAAQQRLAHERDLPRTMDGARDGS